MKEYKRFNVEQFATDEFFRQWVMNPNPETHTFWNHWMQQNPEKKNQIKQAKILIRTLNDRYKNHLPEELVEYDMNELVRLAEASKLTRKEKTALPTRFFAWRIAAIVVAVAGLGWLYYAGKVSRQPGSKRFVSIAAEPLMIKVNDSDKEMTVLLSDNSVATLMKGSKLTYPSRFSGEERKVFLSGEAFFDITKDPKRPFLVFANETVTKVLGTSFRVRAFEQDPEVMVVVKTGKVSVYPQEEYELLNRQSDRAIKGVILSPNQQVVFRKKDNRLEKGIVANPAMLSVSTDQKELVFDEKPVADVLHSLEDIYGIVIVFDAESLSSCVITTQFNEENLKQRMSVICQAIGATYEMIDGQIIVNSKGCSS